MKENFIKLLKIREIPLFIFLIFVAILGSFISPYFLLSANFSAVFLGLSLDAIIVIAMCMLLISGGFDLSVGANLALTPSVWEKSTTADFEVSTYSVYLLPMYKFSDTMGVWMTLGYSAGDYEEDPSTTTSYDINGGMSWGLGVHYKVSDEWGLGLGYGSAGYEVEAKETSGVTKYDFDINSLSMFGTYSF